MSPKTANVSNGQVYACSATITGDTTGAGLKWKTSNGFIDQNGRHLSMGGHGVIITATSIADPTKSDTCYIT
jgi:hypothetical protein